MKKLDIIYEDKEMVVVNKPSGLLTISTGKKNDITLYSMVREYVKKQNPKNKIFIVHRLDKDTSGVVLFAKNEVLKHKLQFNWNGYKREYVAVVEGIPSVKKNRLVHYLAESKTLQVYVTNDKNKGKIAITNYEVIEEYKNKSKLKVWIETGRKNQIRAQLAYIDHPIVGDKKYNSKIKSRLCLHAKRLIIMHPITNKKMIFEAKDRDFGV